MTLYATQIAQGKIYLPSPNSTNPDTVFIRSLSFYDIAQGVYSVSYSLLYNSNEYSFRAFVAFPQVFSAETTGLAYTVYQTENIIDEAYYSIVPPMLIKFYENVLDYTQVGSLSAIGKIRLVYYQGDVLFLMSVPYGVVVYSLNKAKFYTIKLPSSLLSATGLSADYTFLGSHVFGVVAYGSSTVNVVLLMAQFTYSDTVFTSVYSTTLTIPGKAPQYTVNIVGNTSYVVAVIRHFSLETLPTTNNLTQVSQVTFIQYDVNNNTATVVNTSIFQYVTLTTGNSLYVAIGEQTASIYGYNVFTYLYDTTSNSFLVISYNMKTMTYETVEVPVPSNTFQSFLQKNYLIVTTNSDNVVQQGNVYFVPVNYYVYELTTDNMVQVQFTELVLEKTTLKISGKALYIATGQPVANATVGVYFVESVTGDQIAVKSLIGTTKTDSDGNFTFSTTLQSAIPDANIVVTVSVDPIIVQYVFPQQKIQYMPYYP